jgi:hypothetical protein
MENTNLLKALIKNLSKDNTLDENYLSIIQEKINEVKSQRDIIDNLLDQLKMSIIKSSSHLLIEKIHRGDKEATLTILNNTRDRSLFYDFVEILNNLLIEYEKYYQNYEINATELLDCKERLGINDHRLHKLISEINLD